MGPDVFKTECETDQWTPQNELKIVNNRVLKNEPLTSGPLLLCTQYLGPTRQSLDD